MASLFSNPLALTDADPPATALPVVDETPHERADAARNREAILCAAERLLGRLGTRAVTMDEIAAEAGVGKGTLFRRFGDRASLFRALLDGRERAFQEAFIRGGPPLGPGVPARERLVAFGWAMLDRAEADGDLLLAGEGAAGVRFRHPVYLAYRAHVVALLRELACVQDPEYAADVLLSGLSTELVLYQRRVREMDLERLKAGWAALVDAVVGRDPS